MYCPLPLVVAVQSALKNGKPSEAQLSICTLALATGVPAALVTVPVIVPPGARLALIPAVVVPQS